MGVNVPPLTREEGLSMTAGGNPRHTANDTVTKKTKPNRGA